MSFYTFQMPKTLLLILLVLPFSLAAIEPAPLATDEQVKEAFARFQTWTSLYQQKNYLEQYELVHPRIQRYKNFSTWKKAMRKSQGKNGALLDYELVALSAITPDRIPCTEMGHCYRKDMQTVMIIVDSRYEKIGEKNQGVRHHDQLRSRLAVRRRNLPEHTFRRNHGHTRPG